MPQDRLGRRCRYLRRGSGERVEQAVGQPGEEGAFQVVVMAGGQVVVEQRLQLGVGNLLDQVHDRIAQRPNGSEVGPRVGAGVRHEQPGHRSAGPRLGHTLRGARCGRARRGRARTSTSCASDSSDNLDGDARGCGAPVTEVVTEAHMPQCYMCSMDSMLVSLTRSGRPAGDEPLRLQGEGCRVRPASQHRSSHRRPTARCGWAACQLAFRTRRSVRGAGARSSTR